MVTNLEVIRPNDEAIREMGGSAMAMSRGDPAVDGGEILHQLETVVYSIFYRVSTMQVMQDPIFYRVSTIQGDAGSHFL